VVPPANRDKICEDATNNSASPKCDMCRKYSRVRWSH